MNYLGISAGFHDAAISVVDDHGNILFAGWGKRLPYGWTYEYPPPPPSPPP